MNYFLPVSLEEAIRQAMQEASAGRKVKYVAGGTDLAVQIADGVLAPDGLVDLTGIRALQGIRKNGGSVRIGATTTIEELARREDLPACLVQGACSIGSPQVRHLGTIGGNICNASPCGDTLAPVIALGGRLVLASSSSRREVPAEEFFLGPKATVLKEPEVLVEVLFSQEAVQGRSAFRMIGKRNGQAISQVNVAVWLKWKPKSKELAEIRAAAGSVAPIPIRLRKAEALLRGKRLSESLLHEAEQAAAEEIRPISDVRASAEYRRFVTAALFRETLEEAAG